MKTININIILSMILNFIAIILAMTAILNPIVGALVIMQAQLQSLEVLF